MFQILPSLYKHTSVPNAGLQVHHQLVLSALVFFNRSLRQLVDIHSPHATFLQQPFFDKAKKCNNYQMSESSHVSRRPSSNRRRSFVPAQNICREWKMKKLRLRDAILYHFVSWPLIKFIKKLTKWERIASLITEQRKENCIRLVAVGGWGGKSM